MGRDRQRAGLARAFFIFIVGLGAAGVLIAVLNGPFDTVMAAAPSSWRNANSATISGILFQNVWT